MVKNARLGRATPLIRAPTHRPIQPQPPIQALHPIQTLTPIKPQRPFRSPTPIQSPTPGRPPPPPPPLRAVAGCRIPVEMHLSLHTTVAKLPVSHPSIVKVTRSSLGASPHPPACGQRVNGYSAAVNELAFGANRAAGGACGRCFKITANSDPYTPSYAGPFGNTIVVKVNDLCPASSNNQWCGQGVSKPLNSFGVPMQCVVPIPFLPL